jgi:putative oxidoreductase
MLDSALLVLRIGVGSIFFAHGMQKVFGVWGGHGLNGFSQMLSSLGFAPALFWAYVAAFTELVGGILIIAGFFTRGAAALLLVLMVVATVKVHLSKGFFLAKGGLEYNLLIMCSLVVLVLLRAGKYCIERFIK